MMLRIGSFVALLAGGLFLSGCGGSRSVSYTASDVESDAGVEQSEGVEPAGDAALMSMLLGQQSGEQPGSLGTLSANQFDPDSLANPFGRFGNPYSTDSIRNPYGKYGSRFSPQGVTNPYALNTPRLYGADGKYLGKVSSNPYDPDSISNPYGRYGSRYSPNSVNNPHGRYGSPYSPYSPRNPYATRPPRVVKP